MRTELIRIGNSRGIRIPKPLIEQVGLGDTVELRVENDRIIIAAERRPRAGWEEAFRAAGSADSDELAGPSGPNKFDNREWRW